MSSKLSVLSLTAGESFLARQPDGSFNQQQLRQMEYAKHLDQYVIITRTTGTKIFEQLKLASNLTVYPTNSKSKFLYMRDMARLASQICENQRIDVISSRDPFFFGRIGMKLRRKHNIPLVLHDMGDMIDNPYFIKERFRNRILNQYAKKLLKKADAIRVSTSREKRKMIQLGYEKEKIFQIPFFVDITPFLNPSGALRRNQLLQDKFERIILTVTRLEKQKNLEMLVRIAKKVVHINNRILFVLIGKGSIMEQLRRMAISCGVEKNIFFTGAVENSLLPDYYHSADIFVITSFYEGTCMVLLEAAASSLPIVSTNNAGAEDALIENESGYIVQVNDDEAFADKILSLLNNPLKLNAMGKKGREHIIARFNKDKIVRDYISMFEYAALKKPV